jgi:hypothetical protein
MESNNQNWGSKGKAIGIVFLIFVLFVVLLIWVYGMNQNFLPITK